MRKPAFCICVNKGAESAVWCAADQRLRFGYIDSTTPLLLKSNVFKPIAIFYGCTAWFVTDLVGNKDRLSHDAAHIIQ